MAPPKKKPRIINGITHWKCSRCKNWIPESAFAKEKRTSNGLSTACRMCQRKHAKIWRDNNKDKVRAWSKKYIETHKEVLRDRWVEWSERNEEYLSAYNAAYNIRNREIISIRNKEHAAKYPEKHLAKTAVRVALKDGQLVKPDKCEMCEANGKRLYGHHQSYEKEWWLLVVWLCAKCHKWLHARQDEQRRARETIEAKAPPLPASTPTQTQLFDTTGERPVDT